MLYNTYVLLSVDCRISTFTYNFILFLASNAVNFTNKNDRILSRFLVEMRKICNESKDNQLVGGELTIQCELNVYDRSPVVYRKSLNCVIMPMKHKMQHANLFKKVITDSDWHLVTFLVKEKRFSAPFTLLAEQSLVLAAMFTGENWREATEKCAKIDNIEPEVFAELLLFLITGSVSNNEKLTIELLAAAEMVCVNCLMDVTKYCFSFINKSFFFFLFNSSILTL